MPASGGLYTLVATAPLPAASPACGASVPATQGPTVGLLYAGWHAYAANASRAVRAMGGVFTSVEDVLRSGGNLTIADMWEKYGVQGTVAGFDWQTRPALGPYCIYRARPGEAGVLPDCEGIPVTIGQQAAWFATAGVDFVTADGTNLCTPSPFADAIQTRPMEVLFEEFGALRARNFSTPAIAAWQRLVSGCTLHTQVLAIYNDPVHAPLVLRDGATGKKVFFVPDDPDPALIAEVEANGGRNDVLVQEMWALFGPEAYAQGRWAFMSPCNANASDGVRMTTNVVGNGRGATPCGQRSTTNSALGSATAISPSYQLSFGSVPFSAAGKFGGLTLKRQFATVFAAAASAWGRGAGGGLPDNVYLSSWNEWLSQVSLLRGPVNRAREAPNPPMPLPLPIFRHHPNNSRKRTRGAGPTRSPWASPRIPRARRCMWTPTAAPFRGTSSPARTAPLCSTSLRPACGCSR